MSGAAWARFTGRVPRPTRSTALLLLLAAILELLGRLIDSTGVTVAAAAALGAVIGDGVLAPRVDGLALHVELGDRLTAGVSASCRLIVAAPMGRRASRRPVIVLASHPALSPVRVVTPWLGAGGRASADVEIVAARRGFWNVGILATIEAVSPLGGFVRRRRLTLDKQLWVHPAPAQPYRLPEAQRSSALGTSTSTRSGGGTDFYGIRDWRSGDAATSVHWRASARRNQLVVMDREQPGHAPLAIVCGAPDHSESWEAALSRAAASAVAAVRLGRPVTLIGCDSEVVPALGRDVLDWFAELDPAVPLAVSAVDRGLRAVGVGSTVVWVSAAPASPEVVRSIGSRATQVMAPLSPLGGRR